MSILTPRDRATLRGSLLGRLDVRTRAAIGIPLDTRAPGDAYQVSDALAVLLGALEAQASGAPSQILPDQAVGGYLTAHGDTTGLSRQSGESDADYGARILAWWNYRLPTGSPADWVAVAEEVDGVAEAYVYPYYDGYKARARLLCMGPAQGSSVTNTRVPSNAVLDRVIDYINGVVDIHGNAVAEGEQQRIVCGQMHRGMSSPGNGGNVELAVPSVVTQAVDLAIANAATEPFPWSGSLAIASSTGTSWSISGDHTELLGLPWLLFVGTANARGGYVRATPTAATYFSGPNLTKFEVDVGILPASPTGTGYPAPPNWEAVRDAVFTVFDALSPGAGGANRYPALAAGRPSSLYLGGLYAAVMGVASVVNSDITTPVATVTANIEELITLGVLTITAL